MKKGQQSITAVTTLGIGVIFLILLYGVFSTLGTKVNSDFQTSGSMCSNTSNYFNQSSNRCEYNTTNTTIGNGNSNFGQVNLNVSSGLLTAGSQTPTIASVGGFVIIIALLALVAAYAFGAFRS